MLSQMSTDQFEDRVKRLVAAKMAVRMEQLTPTPRLQHDIGVDGADGWELMAEIGESFGVDLSEFQADLHFGPDGGGNPISALVVLLFRPKWARLIPITIGDLVAAARSGRWQTPHREPV
jgi:acyl carrier protein